MSRPPLLPPAELAAILADHTWWPGWDLSLTSDPHLGLMLRVVGTVPDRADPDGRTVDLGIDTRIPPGAMRSAADFGEWLLWRLEEIVIHEAREGLRYHGRLVSDPHP